MKNLVFLDIDGVVNTLQVSDKPFDTKMGKIKRDDGYYYNLCNEEDLQVSNKQAIIWLNKICLANNADIVITSTWRYNYKDTVLSLRNSGLDPRINIIGSTKYSPDDNRSNEILDFLSLYSKSNVKYIILDDDIDDLTQCQDHLIICDTYTGISQRQYFEANKLFMDL